MTNKGDRKKVIKAIANNNEYYKNNFEALKRLEKSWKAAEAIQKGQLPKKTARELLNELRNEERKERIQESYNKVVKRNGEALERLAKELEEVEGYSEKGQKNKQTPTKEV